VSEFAVFLALLLGVLAAKLFARLVLREMLRREAHLMAHFAQLEREAQIAANREKLARGEPISPI
jgi:hypothetical protein